MARLQASTTSGPSVRFGDEVAVHHVDVNHFGPGLFGSRDLLAEPGEVGGENRRGEFEGFLRRFVHRGV